jgi:hypothetical protein
MPMHAALLLCSLITGMLFPNGLIRNTAKEGGIGGMLVHMHQQSGKGRAFLSMFPTSTYCVDRIFIDKPWILFYYHFYSLKLNG